MKKIPGCGNKMSILRSFIFQRYNEKSKGGGELFKRRVRECVNEWRDRIFSPSSTDDPHYLTFSPYEPKVHEPIRQAMIKDAKKVEQEEEQVVERRTISLSSSMSSFKREFIFHIILKDISDSKTFYFSHKGSFI